MLHLLDQLLLKCILPWVSSKSEQASGQMLQAELLRRHQQPRGELGKNMKRGSGKKLLFFSSPLGRSSPPSALVD